MTAPWAPGPAFVPTPPRRAFDVLGLIAVIVAAVGIVPTLLIFLIGLIPEMNAIWWLLIAVLPILAIAGVVSLALGVVGVIVGVRRSARFVLSVIGIVLGLLMLAPIGLLFFSSAL